MMYPLVRELADDDYEVAVACRVLNVSRSGYYDWLGRPASPRQQDNDLLTKVIEQVHKDSRGTYGLLDDNLRDDPRWGERRCR